MGLFVSILLIIGLVLIFFCSYIIYKDYRISKTIRSNFISLLFSRLLHSGTGDLNTLALTCYRCAVGNNRKKSPIYNNMDVTNVLFLLSYVLNNYDSVLKKFNYNNNSFLTVNKDEVICSLMNTHQYLDTKKYDYDYEFIGNTNKSCGCGQQFYKYQERLISHQLKNRVINNIINFIAIYALAISIIGIALTVLTFK